MSQLGTYQARPYKVLTFDVVELLVRQNPEYAVVTPENKEKMRRPVDPPPIVQLHVSPQHDPSREYLVNPFLFMTATLVEVDHDEQGTHKPIPGVQIIGQNVSSLHRLKDIDNKDGGFFVFGDISCRQLGTYRLQFNLFDFDKTSSHVAFVSSVVSKPFRVVSQKEFKGLSESTHLSRTFSDQGVRLRLRKEPRTIAGLQRGRPDKTRSKRSYDSSPADLAPTMGQGMYGGGPVHERNYGYETPILKRARSGSDHTNYGSASSQYSGAGMSQYGHSNAGSAWPSQPQQVYQASQPSYGTMVSHPQLQTGPNPSYHQYMQQDGYSADPLRSNGAFHLNHSRSYPSMTRYQTMPAYAQHQNQSYESRTSRDAYHTLPAPQATASMQDPSLVADQSHDYPASTLQSADAAIGMTAGMLPNPQAQHDRSIERTAAHYGLHTLPIHSANHSYQTHGPTDTIYVQNTQQEMKYGDNNYQPTHNNMYSAGPGSGALSDTALPLDSGMLNRSFAPAQPSLQQTGYEDANGQGIDGYKQEPAPYPTPNQSMG